MLIKDSSQIKDLLICPICSGSMSSELTCNSCKRSFPELDGRPALFHFKDSIFTEEAIAPNLKSRIERRNSSSIGRFLLRLTFGRGSGKSQNNIQELIQLLRERENTLILVIGGGTIGSLKDLYDHATIQIVGTDVYASELTTVVCDAHHLPFRDCAFDAVVVQAVLEHVLDPKVVVAEIVRVLRDEGLVYAETPFMQQVHEGAYDFTRFTRSGHRWLFRDFEQVNAGSILGPGVALIWSIRYFIKSLGLGDRAATLVAACFFWARLIESKRISVENDDAASGFFFLGRKSSKRLMPAQMPEYYKKGY